MTTFYVTMTDKALSGWGHAAGKINKLIFVCQSYAEAEIVAQNALNRSDMKYVNITDRRPYYHPARYYAQIKTVNEYPKWYTLNAFAGGK